MYAPAAMGAEHTLLTIVRHGQTAANVDGVWHGSIDTPLTPHGRLQAAAVGAHIDRHHRPIRHVYASPLARAHDTARAIADPLGVLPSLDPDLAEYHLGDWEGLSFRELWEEKKLFEHMKNDPDFRPHGGESPRQVGDRLAGALRRIADRHRGERVVVVTHGGAMSIAYGVLLHGDYGRWDRMMKNCSISELVLAPRPALLSFNRIDHLPPEASASPHEPRNAERAG